jgi:hypothetical protein
MPRFLLIEVRSQKLLPRLALNHDLPISASQVARITGMSYHTQLHGFYFFKYTYYGNLKFLANPLFDHLYGKFWVFLTTGIFFSHVRVRLSAICMF